MGDEDEVSRERAHSQPPADTQGTSMADQYRSLFENAVEGIYRTTPDGRYLAANVALARIYGYDSPEDLISGLTDIARNLYVDPDDRDRFKRAMEETSLVRNFEAQVFRKDGSIIWISENARAIRDNQDRVVCYEGTVQDITERRRAAERLALAAAVFDNVGEAIIVFDGNNIIKAVNSAFERMTAWPPTTVVGQRSRFLADEMMDKTLVQKVWAVAAEGGTWQGEVWARRANGDIFPAAIAMTGIADADGEVGSYVMLARDITRSKRDEQRIRFHARHDALTRLANRHTVMEALSDAIVRAEVDGNRLAVLFLDVNRFKDVNDSFGHAAGDELLRQVARRLKGCVRASDIIGRLGGDEFVVVLPGLVERKGAQACAEKILYAFSEPFPIAERELYASTSIGIALYPEDAEDAESLLTCADAAMYTAKANGVPFCLYDHDMDRQAADRVNLENDLRHALAAQQFCMHYQPKVEGRSGKIVGAEALIRWTHPERGSVSPALFIPIAERAGLIGAIGDWTLTEACFQMRAWLDAGLEFGCISVNLSPAQFHDAKLLAKVRAALNLAGLSPSMLELEITETMMATDVDRAIAILSSLGEMGVRISIDDFGTGYSSLAYLRRFPINTLKIDRTFVKELPTNAKDGAIVASIVAMAGNLGFDVIAEGVETSPQADLLMDKGCGTMQGFLYSRPLPPEEFATLLAGKSAMPASGSSAT